MSIAHLKVDGVFVRPNGMRPSQKEPMCDTNAVFYRSYSAIGICQYPLLVRAIAKGTAREQEEGAANWGMNKHSTTPTGLDMARFGNQFIWAYEIAAVIRKKTCLHPSGRLPGDRDYLFRYKYNQSVHRQYRSHVLAGKDTAQEDGDFQVRRRKISNA